MSGSGNFSLYNLGNILKYDYRRYNVGIGDNPSIYSRLKVCSSDTGFSSNLWISAMFGGTNANANKIAIGTVNSNAVISAIDINNNFTDLYINNNSVNNYGNVYFLGNIITSNNIHLLNGNIGIGKYASPIVALDVNNHSTNNDIAYFGNSNITYNKLIFTYNNQIPTIGAKDSNNNWTPMIINGDNIGNGNTVSIPNSLFVNNNFYCSGNIGIGTSINSNYRLLINGGNILINNNSSTFIGSSGINNSLAVYGYGFFNSNIGIGTYPTSSYIFSVASGSSIFYNNSIVSIGLNGNNNCLSVYGYSFFSSNIGIGTYPLPPYILNVASGNVLFNNNTNLSIGSSGSNNSLSLYGNNYISGNVGIGTTYDSNKLHVNGNTQIDGTLTATNLVGNGSLITNLNPNALNVTSTFFNSISGNLINYDTVFFKVINGNTLSIIPGSVTASSSQWITLNSTTLYYNPSQSTGQVYVGIGTTSPSGSLQIGNGYRLRVSAGSSSDYSIIGVYEGALNTSIILCGTSFNTYSIPGSIIYNAISGSGYHVFRSDNTEIVRFTNLGQVGIGTIPRVFNSSSNNDVLAVKGNITISDGYGLNIGITNNNINFLNVLGCVGIGTVANTNNCIITNGGNVTFSNSSIVSVGNSGVSNTLTVWGYVGIGRTASSTYIMYVIGGGNVLFDNNITIGIGTTTASGNTNILNVFGATNIYGSIGIGTSSIGTNTMTIAPGKITFYDSSIISIGSTTVSTNNSITLYGSQTIYGTSSLLSSVSIGSTNNIAVGNLLSIYGNTFFANNYTVSVGSTTTNNTNILNVYGNATVYSTLGIGTTYSSSILTVAAGTTTFLNGSTINVGSTSGNTLTIYGSVGIGTAAKDAATCILAINTGVINILNGSTLNVGINTNVQSFFNCYGPSSLLGNVGINTVYSSTSGNILTIGSGTVSFNAPSTINVGSLTSSTNTLNLYGNAIVYNNVYIGQNIGIGTTYSSSTSATNININNNSITNFGTNSTINIGVTGNNNSTLNVYGNKFVYGYSALLGNIGIGTTYSATVNAILTINSGTTKFIDTSIINIGTPAVNNNSLNLYGYSYSSVSVGIGTSADTAGLTKLSISGGANSAVTLYNGNTLNVGISGNSSFLNVYGSVGIGTTYSSSAILTVNAGTINLLNTTILNIGSSGNSTNSLNIYGSAKITTSIAIGDLTTITNAVFSLSGIANFANGSVLNIGSSGTTSSLNVYGNLNINQYSVFNNNVGIGTSYSTSTILTVASGTTTFNNTSIVNVGYSGSTNTLNVYGTKISTYSTTTNNLGIGTTYSTIYTFVNNGSAYFSIPVANAGVGINTTPNSSYSLNVAGLTYFTGDMTFNNNIFIKTSTGNITAPTLAGNLDASYIKNIINISQGGIGTGGGGFTNNSFIYFNNTNVGVSPAFYTYTNLLFTPGTGGVNDTLKYINATIGIGNTIALNSTTGIITAVSYSGSAAGLSNIPVNLATGILPVANGGTGNSANFTLNTLIYANSINSLSSCSFLTINPITSVLTVGGTISATSFSGNGASLTGLSATNISLGTLAVGNGGTGLTTYTANSILFANTVSSLNTSANLTWTLANNVNTLNINGNIVLTNGSITIGAITLTSSSGAINATIFNGSGFGLTNIPTTSITGVLSIGNGGIGTSSVAAQKGAILFSNNSSATSFLSSTSFYYDNNTLNILSGTINASNGTFSTISSITTPLTVSCGGIGNTSFSTNAIVYYNGSNMVNNANFTWASSTLSISGSISCTGSITGLTTPLSVSCGGIGVSSITAGCILVGNGNNAVVTNANFNYVSTTNTLNVSTGTINAATINATTFNGTFAGAGGSITGLSATNITGGTLNANYLSYDTSSFSVVGNKLTISTSSSSPWLITGTTIYNNMSPSATTIGIGTSSIASGNILQINGGVLITAPNTNVFNVTNGTTPYFNITSTNGTVIPNYLTVGQTSANTNTNYALYVAGNIAATQNIGITSDIRLKENIKTIENALDKIKACRGVYFNRINSDAISIGVIAQEIEKILPEVVLTPNDENDYKSVLYQNIVAVLIEAVKDMDNKFIDLDNRIKNLEKNYN